MSRPRGADGGKVCDFDSCPVSPLVFLDHLLTPCVAVIRDLTSLELVTIDDEETKEVDDAICLHEGRVYVAIADPTR